MDTMAVIAGGVLFLVGTAFALFLGMSSSQIEHRREHEAGTPGGAH